MKLLRFAMRCVTCVELRCSLVLKSAPHVGISGVPCAGITTPFRSTSSKYFSGNFPPWRFASVVRSGGTSLNGGGAGPFPFRSFPWHTAQSCLYSYPCEAIIPSPIMILFIRATGKFPSPPFVDSHLSPPSFAARSVVKPVLSASNVRLLI